MPQLMFLLLLLHGCRRVAVRLLLHCRRFVATLLLCGCSFGSAFALLPRFLGLLLLALHVGRCLHGVRSRVRVRHVRLFPLFRTGTSEDELRNSV